MPLSYQTVVSDGTLTQLSLSVEFVTRSSMFVYFDDVEQTEGATWAWVGVSGNTITFTPAVANTVEVIVQRRTNLINSTHQFNTGAQFNEQSLDENFIQILHLAQEVQDGAALTDIFRTLDMHGNRITGLADGVLLNDAVTLSQLETRVSDGATNAAIASAAAAQAAAAVGALVAGQFNEFTSNGVSADFVMDFAVPKSDTYVYINGVYQHKSTYTVNALTLTLNTVQPFGFKIEVSALKTFEASTIDNVAAQATYAQASAAAAYDASVLAQNAIGTVTASASASAASASAASVSAAEAEASAASISGGPVTSVNGATGVVVLDKTNIGLSNVDNTSDITKPVSTTQQAALNSKQDVLVSGTNIKTVNGLALPGSGNIEISSGLSKIEEPTTSVTGLVGKRHHLNAAATTVTAPASADGVKFGVNPMGQKNCFINWGAATLITPGGTFTGVYALDLGLSEDFEFSSTSNKWSSI